MSKTASSAGVVVVTTGDAIAPPSWNPRNVKAWVGMYVAICCTALMAADAKLQQSVTARTHRSRARLGTLAGRLDTLSPLAVLARGYAVCWNEDRTRAIRSSADVTNGDIVHVALSQGEITAKVSGTE